MKVEDIILVKNLLATPKIIAIIPHRSPDGDAMGSTLALYHFLLKLKHNPVVISPNDFPNFLAWLPGSETVLIYENDKEDKGKKNNDAKSYAGYLVFEFKYNNTLVYKIQSDYMNLNGNDIEDRMNCAIKSFVSLN